MIHQWHQHRSWSTFAYEGATTESTYRVTLDETLDAAAIPADLFAFKLPAGAKVEQQTTPRCVAG